MTLFTDARVDPAFLPQHITDLCPQWAAWPSDGRKQAAVACLFAPPAQGSAEARVVLTRRTKNVGSHKGQIAFAGGRADPHDLDPVQTAIRETTEELGIPARSIEVHGVLPATYSIDGNLVVPIVATTDICPEDYVLSTNEVAYVIAAPWCRFAHSEAKSFSFTLLGKSRHSHLFYVGRERVWGLTARILFDANMHN